MQLPSSSLEEMNVRVKLKEDFEFYAPLFLKIRPKEGALINFELNDAQRYLHRRLEKQKQETSMVKAIILKGRQQGCSTYVAARFFHLITHNKGMRACIFAHDANATNNLFTIAKRYYEECPDIMRPHVGKSNVKELYFDILNSGYKVATAGNKSAGRSDTIQLLHGSEMAFWENAADHAKGILQAVPHAKGTEIILESTANGMGNAFHQQWQLAENNESNFQAIFLPFYWQKEYRITPPAEFVMSSEEHELKRLFNLDDAQIYWRRQKITELSTDGMDGEIAFKQEYPFTAAEAFQMDLTDSFIASDLVTRARKTVGQPEGPLIIGVDPAATDKAAPGDSTGIIRRRGRVAYNLEYFRNGDTMVTTGYIKNIIDKDKPAKVFVDVGGIGQGIADRLAEMFGRELIKAVNFGSTKSVHKPERFFNKRAEMWGEMGEWLRDEGTQIPDDDRIHADLTGVKRTFCSSGRLQLESKEQIKRRGLRSPDGADALALTFAQPVPHNSFRRVSSRNFNLI